VAYEKHETSSQQWRVRRQCSMTETRWAWHLFALLSALPRACSVFGRQWLIIGSEWHRHRIIWHRLYSRSEGAGIAQ